MKTNEVTTTEQWLPVKANPAYEVSNLGRVKSNYKNGKSIILSPSSNGSKSNYQFIRIDGKKHYIQALVLEAFIGERPENHDCDHIDKDVTNNKLSNLRYLSIPENRGRKGAAHNMAKLTEEKVKAIRNLYNSNFGLTMLKIGELFNVKQTTIQNVITRRTWSHV